MKASVLAVREQYVRPTTGRSTLKQRMPSSELTSGVRTTEILLKGLMPERDNIIRFKTTLLSITRSNPDYI